MSLTVKCYPFGPLDENTYLLIDDETGAKAIVDPGCLIEGLAEELREEGGLKYILLTHGHRDHFAAVSEYLEAFPDAVFAVPAGEDYLLKRNHCPEAECRLSEGDTVELGNTTISVIATPGHTEGGICFVTDNVAFTGDTLFRLSVGNTSFETGDWATLVRSVQDKLYALPDNTIIYPGHGPASTIGYEKRANPFV